MTGDHGQGIIMIHVPNQIPKNVAINGSTITVHTAIGAHGQDMIMHRAASLKPKNAAHRNISTATEPTAITDRGQIIFMNHVRQVRLLSVNRTA